MKIKVQLELTMDQVMSLAELGGALNLDHEPSRFVHSVIAYVIDRAQIERMKMSGATVTEYQLVPIVDDKDHLQLAYDKVTKMYDDFIEDPQPSVNFLKTVERRIREVRQHVIAALDQRVVERMKKR